MKLGFFSALFLTLLVLKLLGYITIGWFSLIFILCIPAVVVIILIALVLIKIK
jgi:hypothetical protein